MKQLHRILGLVFTFVLMGSFSVSVALAQDPDNGKVLWEEQTGCQRCHGPEGEGKFAGPLAGTDKSAEEFIEQARTPRRNMPSFSTEQVSDEVITDLHAYMASLPANEGEFSPVAVELPADAPEGQMLIVQKRCVACHGETGPIKGFIERGETPTAERVINQLRTPFKNMPSFSAEQVSDAEAALIADFMAAQVSEQAAPSTLPQSGNESPANTALYLSILGIALLFGGFMLRQRISSRA